MTNLDLFMNFCKGALSFYKSAFDKAKNEKISISKKGSFYGNIDKKLIAKLSKLKNSYYYKKVNLNNSFKYQIKNIEEDSFFKESSDESIIKFIMECNMFIKEVINYVLSLKFNKYTCDKQISVVYYECKSFVKRLTNISQTVQLECIFVIKKNAN